MVQRSLYSASRVSLSGLPSERVAEPGKQVRYGGAGLAIAKKHRRIIPIKK